jgi:hypothetical protein
MFCRQIRLISTLLDHLVLCFCVPANGSAGVFSVSEWLCGGRNPQFKFAIHTGAQFTKKELSKSPKSISSTIKNDICWRNTQCSESIWQENFKFDQFQTFSLQRKNDPPWKLSSHLTMKIVMQITSNWSSCISIFNKF